MTTDITTIDLQTLAAKVTVHDNLYNDGGEGYNPYRDEIERRELAASARPRDRSDVLRDMERKDCSSARESGTYDPAEIAALEAELSEFDAAEAAEFDAEWTREVTIERRTAWNEMVKSTAINGKPSMAAVAALDRKSVV